MPTEEAIAAPPAATETTSTPAASEPASFDAELDDIFGDEPSSDDDSGSDDTDSADEDAPEADAASGDQAAVEEPAEAEDPLAFGEDEQPQIDDKGKTYRYSKAYAERELLPARDFLRQLRNEVDPNINVQDIKRAWQSETNFNAIIDDFANNGPEGIRRVVGDFAALAKQQNNPHAIPNLAVTVAQFAQRMEPEWFTKTFVEPFQQQARTSLIDGFQRKAFAEVETAKQAALRRLSGQNLTPAQLEAALSKDDEYYFAQNLLWAAQKLAFDTNGKFLEASELARPPAAAQPEQRMQAERADLDRERAALNQRQTQEQQTRLRTWQTEVAKSEINGIQDIYKRLVSGKMNNQPTAIQDAVQNHTVQEVDRLMRSDKTFMERYSLAVRNAQRTQSSEDTEAALKMWRTRAESVIRTKARELLAQANASVVATNGAAHARAATSAARREPSGQGAPPKRSIATPPSEAKSYGSYSEELNDILG